jgi:hypothetical protein
MKKNEVFIPGMLVCLLTFGLLLGGCEDLTNDTSGGSGSKIPAELIGKWKVEGSSDDNWYFEFTVDKLFIEIYSDDEADFSISRKHIKAGAKGTPADHLSNFCTDYTIGSDGKLTLIGCQIFNSFTFVKITESTNPPGDNKVATPTAIPSAGAVASGTAITLTTTTEGATIYYTLDGSVPSASNGTAYSASAKPIIRAAATLEGRIPPCFAHLLPSI